MSQVADDSIYVGGIGYMTKPILYDRFMNRDFGRGRRAYRYAKAILETGDPGAIDSLLAFTDQHPGLAFHVVKLLRQEKISQLGPWLQEHAHRPELIDWTDLGMGLSLSGWRDPIVAKVLMERVITTDTPKIQQAAMYAFVGIGTLEEVRVLAAIGDTTSAGRVRQTAIAAQARFNVPSFNETVRAALRNPDRDTNLLTLRLLTSLEVNQRHDFLPELRALRERFERNDPDDFLIYVEETIEKLEAKKAEGVKPGAPLDYPTSTRADSTSSS